MDIFEDVFAILNNIWLYGILCIAVITFVIFIHEMGHYLAARSLGVRPELFSIGFGRELIGRTDKAGTRWSLRLYPFGGYVRMYGESSTPELLAEPPEELGKAFFNKPLGHRAMIVAAGPLMNFLFGILLFTAIYMSIGRPAPDAYVYGLEVDGPADKAGIQIGDLFLTVDGVKVRGVEHIKSLMKNRTGEEVHLEVLRNGKQLQFTAIPKDLEEDNSYGFKTHRGTLSALLPVYGFNIRHVHSVGGIDTRGQPDKARELLLKNLGKETIVNFGKKKPTTYKIRPPENLNRGLRDPNDKDYETIRLGDAPVEAMQRDDPWVAVSEAFSITWDSINQTIGIIFQIIIGTKQTTELGGVIKISSMTGDMAGRGIFTFLSYIALLSVNIGLINLLPVPMLDGGHLMFYGAEAIKGSPVSPTAKGYTYGFGLIFMMLTIFIINMNDLLALLKLG